MFHHLIKHQGGSWKYNTQWSIFDKLRGVSSGDETVCQMLDIASQTKWFQKEKLRTQNWAVFHLISNSLIEHQVPLYFLYELLMSLRTANKDMKVNMIFVIEDFQILFQPHRLFIQLWGSSFHFHLFTHSSKYDLFHIFSIPIISTMGYYMNSEWPALQRWLDSAQYIDTYRALCLVFAKVRVCFLVKPEFFRLLFNHLDYSF